MFWTRVKDTGGQERTGSPDEGAELMPPQPPAAAVMELMTRTSIPTRELLEAYLDARGIR